MCISICCRLIRFNQFTRWVSWRLHYHSNTNVLIVYFFKLRFQCAAQWSFYVLCVYIENLFFSRNYVVTRIVCFPCRYRVCVCMRVCYCYFIGRLRFLIFLSLDIIFNPVDVCGIEINKTSIKIVHMKNEWPAICSLASFCVVSNKQTNKKNSWEEEKTKKEQVFSVHQWHLLCSLRTLLFIKTFSSSVHVVFSSRFGFEEMWRLFVGSFVCLRIINAPLCAIQIKVYT